jgi:hypothetical protein
LHPIQGTSSKSSDLSFERIPQDEDRKERISNKSVDHLKNELNSAAMPNQGSPTIGVIWYVCERTV